MTLKRGLTLGKFAPFHKGHQLVIETALAEMDEVLVVIYDSPQVTTVPLNVRAGWIRQIYPAVQVIEGWNGPPDVGDTPEIRKLQEDYILSELHGKRVTHFYSSEFYGDHMSRALGAANRLVDPDRGQVPIDGTQIRQDPYRFRAFLHPVVYRDLVANVVLLGAPSTGKTTLAMRLAEEFDTAWMPEYGREYWEKNQVDRRLSLRQLTEIAVGHLEREDALLLDANRYLFTDTNPLTTYLFSLYYHGRAAKRLARLAEQSAARYDLVFVCDTDIAYDDTWDRSGEGNRQMFQKQTLAELQTRRIPYLMLRGSLNERVAEVRRVLAKFHKFQNLGDLVQLQTTGLAKFL